MTLMCDSALACGYAVGWGFRSVKASCEMSGFIWRARLCMDGFYGQYNRIETVNYCMNM